MNRVVLGVLVLAAAAATSAQALGEEAPARRFGDRRQLIITADRLMPILSYTTQSITANGGDTTTTTTDSGASFAFMVGREPGLGTIHTVPRIAADFTFFRRMTFGLSFTLAFGLEGSHTEEREAKGSPATTRENAIPGATLLGFAPRAGYIIPLSDKLAFWPRAGIAFYSMKSQREQTSNLGVTSSATVTDTLFSFDLDAQLAWTPLRQVIVHAGPLANLPLSGAHSTAFAQGAELKDRSDDLTVFHFGVSVGLGAWLDL